MKKFFAAAMVVASVMASCSNGSNDMVNELDPANKPNANASSTTTNTTPSDVTGTYTSLNLYFPILATQSENFTDEVTVESLAGKQTFNVYDLQSTTDVPTSLTTVIEGVKSLKGQYVYKVYTLKGNFKKGDEIKVTSKVAVKAPFTDFEKSGITGGVAIAGKNGSKVYFSAPIGIGSLYNFDLGNTTADELMSDMAESLSRMGTHTFTVK